MIVNQRRTYTKVRIVVTSKSVGEEALFSILEGIVHKLLDDSRISSINLESDADIRDVERLNK